MEKKKYLLLLTDFYPYDMWEPYLKHEIHYLADSFKGIYILSSCQKKSVMYSLPSNVQAFHLDTGISFFEKLSSIQFVFSKIFWDEIKWVKNDYRLSFSRPVLKIIFLGLQQAFKTRRQLEKFIREQNLMDEEVIAYSFWADQRALACALLSSFKNVKSISRAHNWDVYFERHNPPFLPFRKFIHDNLNALFFVAENGRDYSLKKITGSSPQKFRVSKLGTSFISRNPEASSQELVVVSCSRIATIKRVDRIAEILSHLHFPLRWVHFGGGPLQDSLLEKVNAVTAVRKNFQFEYKGDVENDVVLQFYKESHVDLFILTSDYEGIPMAIMEAQSFGIPVMATNVGGISELLNDSNGFLLDKNFDSKEAAEKIQNYFSLPEEKKRVYKENSFRMWNENFNAEINYPKFIAELLSL